MERLEIPEFVAFGLSRGDPHQAREFRSNFQCRRFQARAIL